MSRVFLAVLLLACGLGVQGIDPFQGNQPARYARVVPPGSLNTGQGQSSNSVPYERLRPEFREMVRRVVDKADFTFQSRTEPRRVRVGTMERFFEHPRLTAAMWRSCRFVPTLYAFVNSPSTWSMDDTRGLKGSLFLLHKQPGLLVYYVDGRAEKGRLKTPFVVSAKMVAVYRYGESPKGFESIIQSWVLLDSSLLGFVVMPFRAHIRYRLNEFIDYIVGNLATLGEFAQARPEEFRPPLRDEGDPVAIEEFETVFGNKP